MKTLIAVVLVVFFCLSEIQATEIEPIKLGKNPAMLPPKNPQDCDIIFERGDYEEALQCYNNTTILNPNDAEAWNYKGPALFQMDRLDEALLCFERAIQVQLRIWALGATKDWSLKIEANMKMPFDAMM
jgi:tetratricopeptide (TPR) repeat protein